MIGLVVAVFFIVMNGFFVAAEFALVKVRATELRARVGKGDKRALVAQSVVSRLDRYLSVTQFGITLASLGLGWIGEPAIVDLLMRVAGRIVGGWPPAPLHVAVAAIAFGALTFSHILFGELIPKLIAIQRSERTVIFVAGPLRVIYQTFRPLLWVLERASGIILRAMGMSPDAASEGTLSEEEILGVLAATAARGPSGKIKSELFERVMRFAQRTARHAMVPRVDVASLPIDTPAADAVEKLRGFQFSRVLLTKSRSLDEVAGYVYAKDFFLDQHADELPDLWSMRRDALFVPETQGLVDVLREMQRTHTPIAVVVDEYGGTSGIVTMEDLLEEIVGEIRDEFDEEPAHIIRIVSEEATWEVDARATMDELRGIGVEVSAEEAGEPVGAVVLARLGRLPRKGDRVVLAGLASAEVTAQSGRRVTRVRVRMAKPAPG